MSQRSTATRRSASARAASTARTSSRTSTSTSTTSRNPELVVAHPPAPRRVRPVPSPVRPRAGRQVADRALLRRRRRARAPAHDHSGPDHPGHDRDRARRVPRRVSRGTSRAATPLAGGQMSALTDLLVARTALTDDEVSHLQRLVGEWQLLSDLSFADLLLWVPLERRRAALRRAVPPDDRADGLRQRPGRRDRAGRPGGVAATSRLTEGADLPRHRPRLGRRPAGAPRGDPDPARRPDHRGARPRQQPGQHPQPEPARAGLSAERGRPRLHDRRGHVPGTPSPRPKRSPARGSATACCGSSATARSSTRARTRCRRFAGSA